MPLSQNPGPPLTTSKGQIQPHYKIYAGFYGHLNMLNEWNVRIDYEILCRMLALLDFADARPIGEPDSKGFVPHIVYNPGCRVTSTQKTISETIGCHEERVRRAIKVFRDTYIIMNYGNGWYDFAAEFFWKGKEEIRMPYMNYQDRMAFPPIEIVGGSKVLDD